MTDISISYIFKLLLRRLYIVIIAAILFATIVFSYCFWFATPIYSANAQLIISNGAVISNTVNGAAINDNTSRIASTDIQASMYLTSVCAELIQTSPEIYKKLAVALDNKYTHQQLASAFSISMKSDETLFINIACRNASPEEAVRNVNAFLAIAPDFIQSYLPEAKALPTAQAEKATVVSPQTIRDTIIAFVLGAFLAFIIVLIIDLNDKTIKGDADFTEAYSVPVLGSVPDFETTEENGGYEYGSK